MKDLKSITAFISKKQPIRYAKNREFMQPARHWMFGLAMASIFFVCSIAYIVFDFYKQIVQPTNTFELKIDPIIYKEKDIIRLDERYLQRELRFTELRGSHTSQVKQYEVPANTPTTTPLSETGSTTELSMPLAEVELTP